jgi:hypothetical protein
MVNISTRKALFEVAYGRTPRLTVDLANLPMLPRASITIEHLAERVTATHEEVQQHLENTYAKYKSEVDKRRRSKVFQKGDLVMVYLRKGRLPVGAAMIMPMLLIFQRIWPFPQHSMWPTCLNTSHRKSLTRGRVVFKKGRLM